MSGAKIAIPTISTVSKVVAVGTLSVPILFGVAAVAAAAVITYSSIQAQKEAEAERARLKEWEDFLASQRQRREVIGKMRLELESASDVMRNAMVLSGRLEERGLGERRAEQKAKGSSVEGFTDLGPSGGIGAKETRQLLVRLNELMKNLPADFKSDDKWPYKTCMKQLQSLAEDYNSGRRPSVTEIAGFHETVSRTVSRYLDEKETADKKRVEMLEKMDRLMNDLIVCRYMAMRAEHVEELEALQDGLSRLVRDDEIDWGDFDVILRRYNEIKQEVDVDNQWRAYRKTLAESMTKHMVDLGYVELEAFKDLESMSASESVWAVPGGERLTISLGADGKLDMRLSHERKDQHSPLSEKEISFYRKQEDRWSNDFRELIRRLTREGFSYQVQLEDFLAEDAIPIAVVETAEDILDEETERRETMEQPQMKRRE